MKLNPGEHTLLASFAHGPDAEKAVQALKNAGYADVLMDRIDQTGYQPDIFEERPPTEGGGETSLVRAVLKPGQMDGQTRVLLGATTDASGLSGPSSDVDMPFMVTIVTRDERVNEAVRLIQELGGRV
ncbi:MAG TPA: hypothetical protein VNT01_05705 [Symbiobacteriaceae bacterium]|nr:hypothetical protein [Symbiobacteriaceae bacterium]